MLSCPHCKVEMKEVSARANPGTLIVLDQCNRCGGIWCDKWELFPIDPEESKRLDPVNEEILRAPVPLEKEDLYCPRCTDRLQTFHDRLLPADIQFRRCRRCEGIWLNRGQFARYKRLQQKIRLEKLPAEERIQRLAQAYQNPHSWVTTGTKGIFAYPGGEEENRDWSGPTLGGAVRLILQALLRLVLNF